jgi:two-component system NtrC family sensor kinase
LKRRFSIHSLQFRIIAAFLAALMTTFGAQAVLMYNQLGVGENLDLVAQGYLPLSNISTRLEQAHQRVVRDVARIAVHAERPGTGAQSSTAIYTNTFANSLEQGKEVVQQTREMGLSGEERAVLTLVETHLNQIGGLATTYEQQSRDFVLLLEQGGPKDNPLALAELRHTGKELAQEVAQLNRLVDNRIQRLTESTQQSQTRSIAVAASLGLLAFAFSIVLIVVVVIAIRPIRSLTTQIQRLSGGDFSGQVAVRGSDEIAVLAESFNKMVQALKHRDLVQFQTQQRLAQSERLALVGKMLAQITHEVRNPLNAMSLNAEMLAEELEALDPKKGTEAWSMLGTITAEIERLTDLSGHYLQLARRPRTHLESQDLTGLIKEVAHLLQPELDQQKFALHLDCPGMSPLSLDGNQLRQALLNIIRNAIESGAKSATLSTRRTDGWLELSLTDDGPGMTAEQISQACDPFWSTKAQGTGLGLAITQQIMEEHAGRLTVHSDIGQGTRVVLSLPDGPTSFKSQQESHVPNNLGG